MWNEYLINIGLTPEQAKIYGLLLELGSSPARKITLKAGIKRGLVYKVLDQLTKIGLVEKNDKQAKITLFSAMHPSSLREFANKRKTEMENAEKSLGGVIGQMSSAYNLISGKPNVQFFEGSEGVRQVSFDALEGGHDEILEYIDNESVVKYVAELNNEYASERKKRGIRKRMLCVDTPFARNRIKSFDPEFTEARITKATFASAVMQIYGNKVSTVTLNENRMIGVIVEDKEISDMNRAIFEVMWQNAEPVDTKPTTPSAESTKRT